jgi:hypothetical protein
VAFFAALVNLLKASHSTRWGALITLVLIALGMRWECWIFRPQPTYAIGFAIPAQIEAPATSEHNPNHPYPSLLSRLCTPCVAC